MDFDQSPGCDITNGTCEIYSFVPEYHLLHQVILAHLLCHVTNVTAFNKCFNLAVKPAKSIILYNMSMTIPNMQDIQQQQMFFIYFYLNDAYQIWLLKIGRSLWVV